MLSLQSELPILGRSLKIIMKLYLVLLVVALPLISCNETKNQVDNRALFESSRVR